eukprot:TRINITY_DN6204_c0_g1_i1.p1 TRINITY_DN6204_c0_g1~~TRINITY_DN6204_c0_g1_i1.p1  ORF type:complete len:228 (-),score=72.91 TRINITY_DN6204_c0_g1_i1:283-966(-)
MLRSLVGSEMCIRDRVSTQSTGVAALALMSLVAAYSSSEDEQPAPKPAPRPAAAAKNMFQVGGDDSDEDSSDGEQSVQAKQPEPESTGGGKKLPSALDAFDAFVEPEFLQTGQREENEWEKNFLAAPSPKRQRPTSPEPTRSHPERMPESMPAYEPSPASRTAPRNQNASVGKGKGGGKGGDHKNPKGQMSFNQKEKRKRDMGMQSRHKNYVEEEKRVLRNQGGGYD